ncbi:YdcF family protein [Rhodococcus sp. 077-4]|uniref:YdcF family protein n=1 Tax=Rhodococcus sp. 077-4 TaxID=2789271 RepID=UPI0039F47E35
MLFLAAALVLIAMSFIRIGRDPRRLSNGPLVIAALVALVIGLLSLLHRLDARIEAILVVAVLTTILLSAIGLVGAAAVNGVVVMKREGLRLSTALPLALAVAVVLGVGLLVAVAAVLETNTLPLWFLAALWTGALFSVCLGVQLAAFSVHALIYGHLEPPEGSASVVVLGCGLGPGGSVTPLLASRLDRALDVYNAEVTSGHRPALVVSGGQGTDEQTAEATAMKGYLIGKGVPDDSILTEARSRNTRENVMMTMELLASSGLRSEPIIVVTSNFHVLRTAAFTRDLGLDAHVTGSDTARFYAPTAFLREFAAILRRFWKPNLALLVAIASIVVTLQHVN